MAGSVTATSAGTALQDKIFIANIQFIPGAENSNCTINVTVANIGLHSATIMGCALKDEKGDMITFIEIKPTELEKSTIEQIALTIKPNTIVDGKHFTLTVVTVSGGSFVSSAFNTSSSTAYDPLKDEKLQSMLQATPASQTIPTPYSSFLLSPVLVVSAIAAAVLVMGAYKISHYMIGSKNRKDRYVLFFFISVIFVSIMISVVYAIWFSGTLTTM
jgi:hypothetical protein